MAVKVKRPNIRGTISTDLEILAAPANATQATILGQICDFGVLIGEWVYFR